MIFFMDFEAVLKFSNFQGENQACWEFSSEKKTQCLAQSGDFVSGKSYQTKQYHSWLGHEDKGQESKSEPKESVSLSSLVAEYQNSSQIIYTHTIYQSKSDNGAIFTPISQCQPFHHLSFIPEVPLFPVLYPSACGFVGRRWDPDTSNISPAKRSDGIRWDHLKCLIWVLPLKCGEIKAKI